ncbi:CD1871A family CXXC motif-containing protein, partial [Phascolarctobacterium faecium]|uniref:CD1871A family CXXC motif-containing protein n=1 Tax=Phascolarctobacterium faecium TaxID=33025 RepID=UPI003AB4BBD0
LSAIILNIISFVHIEESLVLLMKKYLWLIALIFLSIGIWQQQYLSVLRKAAMICLECIGIG